jgi:hypothetical protein
LTIKELRNKKRELEESIFRSINSFQELTGLIVENIYIDRHGVESINENGINKGSIISGIEAIIKLEDEI